MGTEKTKTAQDDEIATVRDALRHDFPSTGILYDAWTGRWKAVWGKHGYAEASSAGDLRQQLQQKPTS